MTTWMHSCDFPLKNLLQPFFSRKLALSVSFCKRNGCKGCLHFVLERVNELPVTARNVNKGGQFLVITTGSPCIGNLIEKRPSDLCPFGKDIQVIAVHVTLVTLPYCRFPEDLDFPNCVTSVDAAWEDTLNRSAIRAMEIVGV